MNLTMMNMVLKKLSNWRIRKKNRVFLLLIWMALCFVRKYRKQAIIRSCLEEEAFCEKFSQHSDTIKKIEVTVKDWAVKEVMSRYGFSPTDPVVAAIFKIWEDKFFTNHYLHFDRPYDGCVHFVQSIFQKGVKVVYLTARKRVSMLEGTLKSLKQWGYPLEDEKNLLMKEELEMEDSVYKALHLEKFSSHFNTIAFFENEPVILNEVTRRLPQVYLFWMDSTHSHREHPPKNAVPVVMNCTY